MKKNKFYSYVDYIVFSILLIIPVIAYFISGNIDFFATLGINENHFLYSPLVSIFNTSSFSLFSANSFLPLYFCYSLSLLCVNVIFLLIAFVPKLIFNAFDFFTTKKNKQ